MLSAHTAKYLFAISTLVSVFLFGVRPANAADDWKFEITPYLWLAGIDGDVTVGNRKAEVDIDFDDLFDAVDFGGAMLGVAQYDNWVVWGQFDYFALDTNNVSDGPQRARLESDALLATLAFGYNFSLFGDTGELALLGGARYLGMENELTIGPFSGERSNDVFDAVIIARPSVYLLDWLRFNPVLSIGAGDSELVYELWPQIQIQLTELLAVRLGYRRLHYEIENGPKSFDGAFHGFMAGLGFTF